MTSRKSFLDLSREGKRKRIKKLVQSNPKQNLSGNPFHDEIGLNQEKEEEGGNFEKEPRPTCSSSIPWDPLFDDFEPIFSDEDEDNNEFELDPEPESEPEPESLEKHIQDWATKFNIAQVAITALLSILRINKCFSSLPSDARTILKTPRNIAIKNMEPGHYHHIGIGYWLNKLLCNKNFDQILNVELIFGIDGLPLFNSNAGELWPILGSIFNVPQLINKVFPIGLYYGLQKPISCMAFLKDFVEDLSNVIKEGIIINGRTLTVTVKGICCDAPAKSFILGTKGHAGYFSCTRCKEEGHYINHRVTFPLIDNLNPRTHEGFLRREDKNYNLNKTPLTAVPGLHFVNSFPLDYMHLVCLGVMRTLMYTWVYGTPPLKLPHLVVSKISSNLVALQTFIPSEFCRKPRSLDVLKRWKATEYRQILLYTGPLVLKDALLPDLKKYFDNFMVLHVAMRILLSPRMCHTHLQSARELLIYFVKTCKIIYGQHYMTHNFHGLLHICDDIIQFGPLDKCSAFKFENFLYPLKKLVRKPEKPLQQISRRLIEIGNANSSFNYSDKNFPEFLNPHFSGPLPRNINTSEQFHGIKFLNFKLQTTPPDSCCKLVDGTITNILNIVRCTTDNKAYIIFKRFLIKKDIFGPPLCPSSAIGIFEVQQMSGELEMRSINEINEKMVFLEFKEKSIVFPQLHFE